MFAIFAVFRSRSAKKSSRKIKLPSIFSAKNLLHRRIYTQKYWFKGENAIYNSVGEVVS